MKETTSRARNSCTSWIITPLMMYPSNIWNSWILLPLWVLQLFLMTNQIITIGILIFEVEGQGSDVDVGWVVCLAFMFISILLTAGEIGLSFAHALHPWTFLGIQVFKSTFWIIYFAVGIITTVAQRGIESNLIWTAWQIWQAVGISLALVIILAALVYGSVVVHKYRKTGKLGLEADFVGVEKGHGLEPPRERAIMGDVPWPER